jgi:hypothetical protein
MVIWPEVSPPLVSGPPPSSDLNWPNEILYLLSSPAWQNGRFGHSAGPPRIESLPEHLLATCSARCALSPLWTVARPCR